MSYIHDCLDRLVRLEWEEVEIYITIKSGG